MDLKKLAHVGTFAIGVAATAVAQKAAQPAAPSPHLVSVRVLNDHPTRYALRIKVGATDREVICSHDGDTVHLDGAASTVFSDDANLSKACRGIAGALSAAGENVAAAASVLSSAK